MTDVRSVRWPASVIVVEARAHLRRGHFPKVFTELADGFVEAGVHAEVLTTSGWAAGDGCTPGWRVHRFGPLASRLHAVLQRMGGTRGRGQLFLRRVGTVLSTAMLVQNAGRLARKCIRQPAAVLFVSGEKNPAVVLLLSGLASGSRPFIVHQESPRPGSFNRVVARVIRGMRAVLNGSAPPVALAVPDPLWIPEMSDSVPGIPAECILMGGARTVSNRRDEARASLGLEPGTRVALLFGAGHADQDPETVFEAFRTRSDWLLVVAGETAQRFDDGTIGQWSTPPLVIGGFIDPTIREALYQAADVVVLSFVPGYRRKSGTLFDAVSHGRGVVVSDQSLAGEHVSAWGMGEVFTSGSAESLSSALDRVDLAASHRAAVAVRDSVSNKAAAIQHLEVFARLSVPDR